MATGLFKSAETMAWSVNALRNKFLCADAYDPTVKFIGDATLIRAGTTAGRIEDVGHDYGLQAVSF